MMSTRYVVLGLFLFLGFAAKVHAIKVAIVGGGIASASAAFHLRELLSSTDHLLEIDVYVPFFVHFVHLNSSKISIFSISFHRPDSSTNISPVATTTTACRFEASDHVGGRTSSITLEGDHTIEMGASIIHAENEVALKLAKLSNLTLSPPQGSEGGLLALFDGTSLVFRQSPWTIITVIKILWRYGLDPLWYRNAAIHFLQDFKRIYALQSNGTSFTHPKDLLHTINCFSLTQMSFVQFIHDTFHGYGMFAAEVVAAASRVNYNQENVELNALAGLVSLLPVVDSRVFTIREGNQRLAERVLLDASGASVHLNSPVAAITGVHPALSRTPGGGGGGRDALMMSSDDDDEDDTVKKYKITLLSRTESSQQEGEAQNRRSTLLTGGVVENSQNEIGDEEEEEEVLYDVVIVAAPLTGSGIVFNGVELPTLPKTRGQETVVTIVKGVLRPTFFGLPPGRLFPFGNTFYLSLEQIETLTFKVCHVTTLLFICLFIYLMHSILFTTNVTPVVISSFLLLIFFYF